MCNIKLQLPYVLKSREKISASDGPTLAEKSCQSCFARRDGRGIWNKEKFKINSLVVFPIVKFFSRRGGFLFLRKVFITVLIFAWIFFGWPKIWQNSPFPPKIQQALAAEVAIDTTVSGTIAAHQKSSKQNVCISDTVCYVFYIEADSDINYQKSTDGGASWGGTGTDIDVGTFFALAIWYDRWTPGDTTGNLVHIVYLVGTHDLVYAVFNTSDDSFTAGVVIAASGAQGSLGAINDVAVSKGTDGDLYAGTVDATIPTSPASFFINVPAPAPRTPTGFQPVLTHGTALAMIRARHMPLLYCPCQTTQRTTRAI